MSEGKTPSLADQGRQLTELRHRIDAIYAQADERAAQQPKHAKTFHAQAQAEAAPLIAEGATLRDAIVLRARRRARRSWGVVYVGIALTVLLVLWWLLRG